ncbi:MAG: hypothetical protein OXT72_02870 [Gammaproteobacteria bacterium]|nr:hypothetical protein [Gammaproteobacteria bacterium]MDE0248044.1 hypothetical protein [Gammaproteobacteria bacterium]
MTRRRKPKVGIPLLLALTATVPRGADAQRISSPYEFIEGTHTAAVVVGTVGEARGELGIGPGGGTLVAGRYGIELRGPLAVDVHGFFVSTDRMVFDPVLETGLVEIGPARTLVTGLEARLRFTLTGRRTWYRTAPFVVLGGGIVGDLAGPPAIEAEVAPEAHFNFGPSFVGVAGTGIRIVASERIEFRGEVNYRLWKLGTPVAFRDLDENLEAPLPEQEWIGPVTFALEASYSF